MPRVVIFCEYPTLLGGERSLLSTLPALQQTDFEVCLAAPPTGPLADAAERLGATVVACSNGDELAAVLDRLRPDLFHANSLSAARKSGPVVAAAGVPSIGHLRDIVKLSRQAVADVNCHRRLVAVSNATRAFHVGQGVDAAKCAVIHNGVDPDVFRPRGATGYLHAELGSPAGAPLVATIGQIGLRKGVDVALSAARLVPSVHWLVVGERTSEKEESRQFEERLHLMAQQAELAGRVHFLGTRCDVPALMCECAVLVHAARQEPLGRVLIEAAGCGLPVIATDVGGTREIFPSAADGAVLVPVDDVGALAAALNALLGDPRRRTELGHAARRRAETAFDVRQAAARLIDLYRNVLDL